MKGINDTGHSKAKFTAQKFDHAKIACNKYLQLEPSGPLAEEVKSYLATITAK
jgi:hypothetical protein